MPRNKNLELNYVGRGSWATTDGRFVIVRVPRKAAFESASYERQKKEYDYSIRDLRGYQGPKEFPLLAPELGRVRTYSQVYNWLVDNADRPGGPQRTKEETDNLLSVVFK